MSDNSSLKNSGTDNPAGGQITSSVHEHPRLPADVMHIVFKFAQRQDLSSLVPILRTSRIGYELAMPML